MISLLWLHRLMPDIPQAEEGWRWVKLWRGAQNLPPFAGPLVPPNLMKGGGSPGAPPARALLIVSAIWRSWKIGFLTLLGAAVMTIGPVTGMVPDLGILSPLLLCLAAGGALALLGFLFGRDT